MITLPALQLWLGQELEMRGIDAVIYTRYILSILQQENFEPDSEFDPFVQTKEWRSSTKGTRSALRKYRRSWTADDWKKNAVLECLQGVTDKECGIESLVEELCVKLKRVKEERDKGTRDGVGTSTSDEDKLSLVKPEEKPEQNDNQESQAAKYYQAFPALSDKTNTLMTLEPKPHGAWGASKKPLSPDGQREVVKRDRRAYKSISACASRGSKSPTRKHQRAKSLPNSRSCEVDNLLVIPKYQTKKGCGRKQTEGGVQIVRSRDKTRRVEKTFPVMKPSVQAANNVSSQPCCKTEEKASQDLNTSPNQSPEFLELADDDVVDEEEISWYMEPVIPVLEQGKTQSRLDTVYRSGSGSPCVKTSASDISLEDAVNSLAESLCRDIFDDGPQNTTESSEELINNQRAFDTINGQCMSQQDTDVHSLLEGDSAERGRHGVKPDLLSLLDSKKPDLYASQGRNETSLQAMPVLVVDSQASLGMLHGHCGISTEVDSIALQTVKSSGSSSQEHLEGLAADMMVGAHQFAGLWDEELPTPAELWERPSYQVTTSKWESDQGSNLEMSSEQGFPERGTCANAPDVPDSLQVQVNNDKIPINSHLGSFQGKESLLRICCPTHNHHLCSSTSGLSEFRPGHFPFSEEIFVPEAPQPSPSTCSILSCSDTESPFYSESEQDSLAKGIKSACYLDESTPVAADSQTFDINNALWSTYDAQSRYPHPPKIFYWRDKSFSKDGVLSQRKSSFIEGGVYGSPYSSQNNSHYNSCSTSPCESGNMRDLWNPTAVQQVSSLVTSMHHLISPESGWRSKSRLSDASSKRGAATPEHVLESSQQDEQSLIEDSLKDSPVFICLRSSSRFEFARSVSDLDGSLSPVSANGTETDEMVSEAELLEDILKDEESEPQPCNKNKIGVKDEGKLSDSLKHSFLTEGSSQELTPSWLTPQDVATCFPDDPCSEKSQNSLSLTGIVPSISKPEAVWKGKRPFDLAVGGSSPMRQKPDQGEGNLAMDELLISPKTHFRPIHETISPDDFSGDAAAATGTNLVDSPHPVSDSHMNRAVGSPIRKSPTTNEWSVPLPTEQTTFHTGSPHGISSKAKSSAYPHSKHMKYENLPWMSRSESQQGTDYRHHEEAEFNPMMNLTHENQIFAFEDEVFLQGEVQPELTSEPFKPLYSSELEEMLLGEAAGNAGQGRLPWRKHRRKTCVHKKPCSFFLEGKCRRVECPFAHDVSHITCRFWEEGQCLKGQDCPFLHSYPSGVFGHSFEEMQHTGSRYGQMDSRNNQRRERQDDTRLAQAQAASTSPVLTTEGAIRRANPVVAKVGPVPSDLGPKHARSLPIRIHFKPR